MVWCRMPISQETESSSDALSEDLIVSRNRDIELLRAIAIIFVMVLHSAPHFLDHFGHLGDAFTAYTALWSGVDLFFCVSGYVIARSMRDLPADTFAQLAPAFWIRRIFRLWPSAWLWATAGLLLSVVWNSSGIFGQPIHAAGDVRAAFLNFENFHYWHCIRDRTCGDLPVYWSLSLEEQFYWLFPFLMFYLSRRELIAVLAIAAVIQIPIPRASDFTSLLWLVRSDAICIGMLLAMLEPKALVAPMWLGRRWMAPAVTLALVALLGVIGAPVLNLPPATGLLALVSGGLVWLARFDQGFILRRSRFDPVLLWIGSRSYSLYLVHEIAGRCSAESRSRLLTAGLIDSHVAIVLNVFLIIGLTLAFAELSFRYVERPLRTVGRRLTLARRDRGLQIA
jgi:peptidoglycan/LPS O-acetylase OafA/YrhL